ncbi:putative HNHc nuclease [Orenia marismortui]|uniref:Putative HNHc nuclease n=1 Tax=Orenia marismortui TaxID=46469 RepID=A0A4R8H3K4_9FIRM|nr:putative HNHc nuclease [Orenia marismortui]TDX49120.1 putative HNHc nuclease [Orenia marismortui]
MEFPAEIGFYDILKSGGMNLPLQIDNSHKKEVQKNIHNFSDKPLNLTLIATGTGETYKINCILKSRRKRAKFYRLVFYLDQEEAKLFEPNIYKFDEIDLTVKLNIDADEQKKILNQISPEQRKKIYAILHDIERETGQGVKSLKETLKKGLVMDESYQTAELFSLSDCPKKTASEFIEFLIDFCFKNSVPLKQHPKTMFDDIERYVYICLKNRICSCCGAENNYDKITGTGTIVQVHHVQTIGMGVNRNKYDDSEHLKISLCSICHSKAHQEGWETFSDKHHLKGVIYQE